MDFALFSSASNSLPLAGPFCFEMVSPTLTSVISSFYSYHPYHFFLSCLLIMELLRLNFWVILISICLHNLKILRLNQLNGIDPKSYFARLHLSSLLQTTSLLRWTCLASTWNYMVKNKSLSFLDWSVSFFLSLSSVLLFSWSSRLNTFCSWLLLSFSFYVPLFIEFCYSSSIYSLSQEQSFLLISMNLYP